MGNTVVASGRVDAAVKERVDHRLSMAGLSVSDNIVLMYDYIDKNNVIPWLVQTEEKQDNSAQLVYEKMVRELDRGTPLDYLSDEELRQMVRYHD